MDSRRRKLKVWAYQPFARTWVKKVIDDRPHPITKAKETKYKTRVRKALLWALLPAWVHLLRGAE